MKTFIVSYVKEHIIETVGEVEVEANSAEEAEQLALANYMDSKGERETDCTFNDYRVLTVEEV